MAVFELYAPADITPLQVWNLPLAAHDSRPLWEVFQAAQFVKLRANRRPYALAEAIALAARAVPTYAFDRGLLKPSHRVPDYLLSEAIVYGGLVEQCFADLAPLRHALALRSDVRVKLATKPREYVKIVTRCWYPRTAVLACDVGQSSIKLYPYNSPTIILTRDRFVPLRDCNPELALQFIGSALKCLVATAPPGTPLILALPWPLDKTLVPGESTYNVKGQQTFMERLAQLAGLAKDARVRVANDAVLAAECARFEANLLGNTLALTLGHGPGAAILHG